jgi:exopolyphosphatase/guanosine-5'-triphosphate,3'-diphosphate pyrophosphatase
MGPRRSAFIDVGKHGALSNRRYPRDRRFRVLDDLADISRLGRGRSHAPISTEGNSAPEILERYRDNCQSLGVEEIFAVGTSALRDAENSAEVRARLHAKLGFEIRVISGAEEAAYSFLAVTRALPLTSRELIVVDIGGGSSEFIRGNDGGVSNVLSADVGSVRRPNAFFIPIRCAATKSRRCWLPLIVSLHRSLAALPAPMQR